MFSRYFFETLTIPRAQKKTVMHHNLLKFRVALFVTCMAHTLLFYGSAYTSIYVSSRDGGSAGAYCRGGDGGGATTKHGKRDSANGHHHNVLAPSSREHGEHHRSLAVRITVTHKAHAAQ